MSVSVKACRGGGKWGVDHDDLSADKNLVFVFLLYKEFDEVTTAPEVWVMPAKEVEKRKKKWFSGSGLYYSGTDLDGFKDQWKYFK